MYPESIFVIYFQDNHSTVRVFQSFTHISNIPSSCIKTSPLPARDQLILSGHRWGQTWLCKFKIFIWRWRVTSRNRKKKGGGIKFSFIFIFSFLMYTSQNFSHLIMTKPCKKWGLWKAMWWWAERRGSLLGHHPALGESKLGVAQPLPTHPCQ